MEAGAKANSTESTEMRMHTAEVAVGGPAAAAGRVLSGSSGQVGDPEIWVQEERKQRE